MLSNMAERSGISFLDSSVGKELTCNPGDPGLIPGLESSPGAGVGYPLQYSWRENPTSGAHTIKTHTWILITVLSIVTSKLLWYIHEMECYSRIKMNELLTHATTWVNLRKKKKKTSKGSQTWETVFVGLHLSAWQPTPVLLPGESCG